MKISKIFDWILRRKVKRSFAVYYVTNDHDMLVMGVANYECDTVQIALAMHRSDYPRTQVSHAIGYVWKEID